jgi:hypothetical protein
MTSETFWNYMQRHWENTIHAADCLTITGDNLPYGESAFVISVSQSQTHEHEGDILIMTEPPSLFRLLPRSSAS